MRIVDTHCHLDFDAFNDDRTLVLERAAEAGVRAIILIGIHPNAWAATRRLSESRAGIVRAAGFHPTSVHDVWDGSAVEGLHAELAQDDIVAVGEIGLDFYRGADSREEQFEAFRAQLQVARELDLPIIIHQRQAERDVLDVLSEQAPWRGVMHCFGGDPAFARACVELGMHLGIGGVATFKRSEAVREAIAEVPLDRLILETDAPFLAPQRWRGKRNEPAYLTEVVDTIADVRSSTLEEVASATTENAITLFGDRLGRAVEVGLELTS